MSNALTFANKKIYVSLVQLWAVAQTKRLQYEVFDLYSIYFKSVIETGTCA